MSFFGLREWKIENTNIQKLSSKINAMKNTSHMQFDMKTIKWEDYFKNYIPGIKKYHFKEISNKSTKSGANYNRFENKFIKIFKF